MKDDDCCKAFNGFRFWTDSAGRIHVTETPDRAEPLIPPFVLRMDNPGNVELPIGVVSDYATMLISSGAMLELVSAWRQKQAES